MKKLILIGMVLLLFVGTTNAAEITLDTLDYEQNKLITIPGNITMTPTNGGEVSLLFRLYDPVSNITIYSVQSNEVDVDYTFVNDTKFFSFLANDNNTYLIGVDYSSIQVPPSLDDIIAKYEALIAEINESKVLLSSRLSEARDALNRSLDEITSLHLIVDPLKRDIMEYENRTHELKMEIWNASDEYNYYKGRYKEYSDTWSLGTSDGFRVHLGSLFLGIILAIAFVYAGYCRISNRPLLNFLPVVGGKQTKVKKKQPLSKRDEELLKGSAKDE